MKFLPWLFGAKRDGQRSNQSTENATDFQGGLTDLEEVERRAKECRWEEGLAILDQVFPLPGDIEEATALLKGAVESSPSEIVIAEKELGRDGSGNARYSFRLAIGGGALPHVMDLRGQCINGVLLDRWKLLGEPGASEDSEIAALAQRGQAHAAIVWSLFSDNVNAADALARSGLFLHLSGRLELALMFFDKALIFDPGNAIVGDMRDLAKQRLDEFGGNSLSAP